MFVLDVPTSKWSLCHILHNILHRSFFFAVVVICNDWDDVTHGVIVGL
jgi:hypothetical protein